MNPIWIGLFDVTGPRENPILHGNVGACLWIAAQAEDAAKLQLRATNVMVDLGLTVNESEQLRAKLIPEAKRTVESVVCGTWHLYENHDA